MDSSPRVTAPIGQDRLAHGALPRGSMRRDVFIYTSDDSDNLIGGLWVSEGITNANLYSMVEIFCIFSDTFGLHYPNGKLVERDQNPLQPGDYFLATNGSITVTDELPLLRMIALQPGSRSKSFRDAVRERDRRCILTGRKVPYDWTTFEATHIFPLAYEGHWNELKCDRWLTLPPATESDGSINSPQNGILLGLDEHILFKALAVSINPDDNYKIVCFSPATLPYKLAGRYLDRQFLEDFARLMRFCAGIFGRQCFSM